MKIVGEYMLRDVAGETVAVPVGETVLRSNILVALNDTGTFLWRRLTEGASEEELVSCVCAEYEADPAAVKKDIAEFIEYLRRNKVQIDEVF